MVLRAGAPIATYAGLDGRSIGAVQEVPLGFQTDQGAELAGAATGAASAITPTLTAPSGKRAYLTGFTISGGGATAASVISVTITGLKGGTMTVVVAVPAGATAGIEPINIDFRRPIPASAINTNIVLNIPSFGAGNTASAGHVRGFAL